MTNVSGWLFWALLSAAFAALTAIFAKVGLEGVDSDFATLIRTTVIIVVLALFVYFTGKWINPLQLSSHTILFLVLSALARCFMGLLLSSAEDWCRFKRRRDRQAKCCPDRNLRVCFFA